MLAWCYQCYLLNSRVWYRHCTHLPSKVQPLLPLLLVIPVGLLDVNLLGGSHMLIDHLITLSSHSAAFASLFGLLSIYFVVRFVGSMLSYGAPVPGGIFMPILVLGAILGALLATLLIHLYLLAAGNYINLVVIGMAAYFGAIEKATFTAICLLTEMVGYHGANLTDADRDLHCLYRQRPARWAANLRRPSRRNVWLGPNKLVIFPTKQ